MATNKYLSIITLNVSILNAPIKRNKITEWIKEHDPHILFIRDPTQNKRPTQTESEGLDTNFTSKQTAEKSQGSITHIRQNRLQKKGHKERPRGHIIILKGRILE